MTKRGIHLTLARLREENTRLRKENAEMTRRNILVRGNQTAAESFPHLDGDMWVWLPVDKS